MDSLDFRSPHHGPSLLGTGARVREEACDFGGMDSHHGGKHLIGFRPWQVPRLPDQHLSSCSFRSYLRQAIKMPSSHIAPGKERGPAFAAECGGHPQVTTLRPRRGSKHGPSSSPARLWHSLKMLVLEGLGLSGGSPLYSPMVCLQQRRSREDVSSLMTMMNGERFRPQVF